MLMALRKVAYAPFAYLIDQVFCFTSEKFLLYIDQVYNNTDQEFHTLKILQLNMLETYPLNCI